MNNDDDRYIQVPLKDNVDLACNILLTSIINGDFVTTSYGTKLGPSIKYDNIDKCFIFNISIHFSDILEVDNLFISGYKLSMSIEGDDKLYVLTKKSLTEDEMYQHRICKLDGSFEPIVLSITLNTTIEELSDIGLIAIIDY